MITKFDSYNESNSFDSILKFAFQKATAHFKKLHQNITEEHVVEFIVHFVINNYGIDLTDTKHVFSHLKTYVHHKIKTIKTKNENLIFEDVQYFDLHKLMCDWMQSFNSAEYTLVKNHIDRGNKEGVALALHRNENPYRKHYYPLFTIRFSDVHDKQLRGTQNKPKMKVYLDYIYDNSQVVDKIFVSTLKEFIVQVFKKYSYFHKKKSLWHKNGETYDFFINKSEIDNIMKELKDDFEFYMNAKKYNL